MTFTAVKDEFISHAGFALYYNLCSLVVKNPPPMRLCFCRRLLVCVSVCEHNEMVYEFYGFLGGVGVETENNQAQWNYTGM